MSEFVALSENYCVRIQAPQRLGTAKKIISIKYLVNDQAHGVYGCSHSVFRTNSYSRD